MRYSILAYVTLVLIGSHSIEADMILPKEKEVSTADVLDVLDNYDLNSKTTPFACATTPDESKLNFLPKLSTIESEQLSKIKCSDIFSEKIPEIIKWTKSYLESDRSFWMPYCSMHFILQDGKLDDLNYIDKKYKEDQKSTTDKTEGRDVCTQPPTENRASKKYKAPSQKSQKVKPMDAAEKIVYESEIKNAIKTTAINCCGDKDSECMDAFKKIKIEYCKNQKSPWAPEPCYSNGTFYTTKTRDDPDTYKDNYRKGLKSIPWDSVDSETLKKMMPKDLFIGAINVSTLKTIDDNSPVDNITIMFHELGHACSSIKNQLEAQRGNVGAFQNLISKNFYRTSDDSKKQKNELDDFIDSKKEINDCTITPEIKSFYTKQFGFHNRNLNVINCLTNVANGATKNRFIPGNCEGGCPRSMIEESFANSIALKSLDKNIEQIIGDQCLYQKDTRHPLGMDEVRCLLKDNDVVKKLKENLKCKE